MPERLIEMEPLERRRLLSAGIPKADHIVIVVEENHSYQDVLGEGSTPSLLWSVIPPMQSAMAPYIQKLSPAFSAIFSASPKRRLISGER